MVRKNHFLLLTLAVVYLSGCAVSPTYVDDAALAESSPEAALLNPVHYKIEDGFIANPPKCIAVLPLIHTFGQKGDKKDALVSIEDLEQLRWSLYSQLAPYPYRDIELADVNKAISKLGTTTDFKRLAKTLKCDAFLIGEVTEYQSGFFAVYSQASIGIKMRLIRGQNEELLWKGSHVARSHGGTIPLSPIGFIMGLYDASENLSDEQLVRVKDDVFRRLLSTWKTKTPDSLKLAETKPKVEKRKSKEPSYLSYVSAYSLWLRAGPGSKYPKKGVLKHKDELEIVDETHSPWVQVRVASGKTGYVNRKYLNSAQ